MTVSSAAEEEAGQLGVGTPQTRGSAASLVIAGWNAERRKPRQISGRDLVPPHIREAYEQRWQAEDRVLLREEPIRAARAAGWLRRALRAIFHVW